MTDTSAAPLAHRQKTLQYDVDRLRVPYKPDAEHRAALNTKSAREAHDANIARKNANRENELGIAKKQLEEVTERIAELNRRREELQTMYLHDL